MVRRGGGIVTRAPGKERGECSFLKKRTKKLSPLCTRADRESRVQMNEKSFCFFFFRKRRLLLP